MEPAEIRKLARFIIEEWDSRHNADLAPKWDRGTVKFVPNDSSLNEHELSMEKFMHKVVMVRNNLRVLEQQVNSNQNLSEGEKVKMQSYISKCYGSLTSFNFMFWDEEDKFSSK